MSDLGFLENADLGFGEGDLDTLAKLIETLESKKKEAAFLDEQLKNLNKEVTSLSRETIPDFLLAKGLKTVELSDGTSIKVESNLSVALPKKDIIKRNLVLKWIAENGGDSIIKKEVSVDEPEQFIFDFLKEHGIPYDYSRDINHNTLKAWFRSKLGMKKGTLQEIEVGEVPAEANLFLYNETKVKR